MCSPQLFSNEISQIKLLLSKNGYPQELVNKKITTHLKNLNKIKVLRPEKCLITLKFPFTIKNSRTLEKKIKQVIRSSYFAVKKNL